MSKFVAFLRALSTDPRIPSRDKKVLLFLMAALLSPFDLIPDWIPVFGQIDDVILLALIFDYLFAQLDERILLAHYPWSLKSYARWKRMASWLARLAPTSARDWLWKRSA